MSPVLVRLLPCLLYRTYRSVNTYTWTCHCPAKRASYDLPMCSYGLLSKQQPLALCGQLSRYVGRAPLAAQRWSDEAIRALELLLGSPAARDTDEEHVDVVLQRPRTPHQGVRELTVADTTLYSHYVYWYPRVGCRVQRKMKKEEDRGDGR